MRVSTSTVLYVLYNTVCMKLLHTCIAGKCSEQSWIRMHPITTSACTRMLSWCSRLQRQLNVARGMWFVCCGLLQQYLHNKITFDLEMQLFYDHEPMFKVPFCQRVSVPINVIELVTCKLSSYQR